MAWGYLEFPEDLFKGETVEEWVPLTGKLGEAQEGNVNLILSLTVGPACVYLLVCIYMLKIITGKTREYYYCYLYEDKRTCGAAIL